MGSQQYLIDSNILIYAVNLGSKKEKKAEEFLTEILNDKKKSAIISHQNILEFLRIVTHPRYQSSFSIDMALTQANQYQLACDVIYPLADTGSIFINLMHKYHTNSNNIFDTYLVATMLSNGVETIATDNVKDFEMYEEISVFNPFD